MFVKGHRELTQQADIIKIVIIQCDGLNRYDSHSLMCLNAWAMGSGTIRDYGLIGISMTLVGVGCHWCVGEQALSSYVRKLCPVWHTVSFYCLWIQIQRSKLFLQHHVCLKSVLFPTMTTMNITFETGSWLQLHVFLQKIYDGCVSYSYRNPN